MTSIAQGGWKDAYSGSQDTNTPSGYFPHLLRLDDTHILSLSMNETTFVKCYSVGSGATSLTLTAGNAFTVTAGTQTDNGMCVLSSSKAVVFFIESSDLKARVVSISGTTTTGGTTVTVDSSVNNIQGNIGSCRVSDTKGVAVWSDENDNKAYSCIFTISGTTLTVQTRSQTGLPTGLSAGSGENMSMFGSLSSSRVLLWSANGSMYMGDASGSTSVTWGTARTGLLSGKHDMEITEVDTNKVIVRSGDWHTRIVTIPSSGTGQVTLGTSVEFRVDNEPQFSRLSVGVSATKAIFFSYDSYRPASGVDYNATEILISGTTISSYNDDDRKLLVNTSGGQYITAGVCFDRTNGKVAFTMKRPNPARDSIAVVQIRYAPSGPPTSVSGTTTNNAHITLNWTKHSDATYYDIRYSGSSGGPWTTQLTNNTGDVATYNDTSAPAAGALFAPTSRSATSGDYSNRIDVSWTNAGTVYGALRYYKLYSTNASGDSASLSNLASGQRRNLSNNNVDIEYSDSSITGPWSTLVNSVSTPYQNTGLSSGLTRWYRLRANGNTDSAWSSGFEGDTIVGPLNIAKVLRETDISKFIRKDYGTLAKAFRKS